MRAALLALMLATVPSSTPAQVVADAAIVPDIVVQTIDGDSTRLHDLLAPKLTVLVRWSTWCVQCIVDMPFLKQLDEEWRPSGVHIVSLFEQDTAVGRAREIIREHDLRYPTILDPEDKELAAAFRQRSLPDGYLVMPDGKVVAQFHPVPDLGMMEGQLRRILDRYKLAYSTPEVPPGPAMRPDAVKAGLRVARGVHESETGSQSMVLHLRMDHADGFHTWPHEPVVPKEFRGVTPIATGIGFVESPNGIVTDRIDWPTPVPVQVLYSGSPVELLSYTGRTTVNVYLTLHRDLVESDTVFVPLRYQACDAEICYPPVAVELTVPLLN